jgi:hypothetical protein
MRLWFKELSYLRYDPMYRQCAMCDLSMRVWKHHLLGRNRSKFCSRRCYYAARRAFSEALADGRLNVILAEERKRAKAERLARFRGGTEYTEMERRYARGAS